MKGSLRTAIIVAGIIALTGCHSHRPEADEGPKPEPAQQCEQHTCPTGTEPSKPEPPKPEPKPVHYCSERNWRSDADLQYWIHNMVVWHNFTDEEVEKAFPDNHRYHVRKHGGIKEKRLNQPTERPDNAKLFVAPYPGGRHPRLGFFEGAIKPHRDTKMSFFTPWDIDSYVVYDLPEAIWSNLGLTYLAHTHLATIWDDQAIKLQPIDWTRHTDGTFTHERTLPNGIKFGSEVVPYRGYALILIWLQNGTSEKLTDLKIQTCLMLGRAKGFNQQTNDNKHHAKPYIACKSDEGNRWIITGFTHSYRTWANAPVPCMHSDPQLPDCPPGKTVLARGIISFYEGEDIEAEFERLDALKWQNVPVSTDPLTTQSATTQPAGMQPMTTQPSQ